MKKVLITGGAGFVGSHLADQLLEAGYEVRVLDNLSEQVHGENAERPDYLSTEVDLLVGDIRDPAAIGEALEGIDAVYHLAAAVGVGQSMYQISHYTSVNNLGTAYLLEWLAQRPVEKLVVASSMSLYGEGLYRDGLGGLVTEASRPACQFQSKQWDLKDKSGERLTPVPTPEWKTPAPPSVYALSKYDQERMCLMFGAAYRIPTVALRFFNIYGPRQALSNPYTGVLAIFASRLLNDQPPVIFEDGNQRRDFVSVHDVARGCVLALETPEISGKVFNIGSGRNYSILQIADRMASILGKPHILPEVTGQYRVGDIRHCFADIDQAERYLGYHPQVSFEEGLEELAGWLEGQRASDLVTEARGELASRGLTV